MVNTENQLCIAGYWAGKFPEFPKAQVKYITLEKRLL